MGLKLHTEAYIGDDLNWLGSQHGVGEAQTVTLDVAKFSAFGERIPSGVPLKEGEEGLYEPVAEVGDKLAGFLLVSQKNSGPRQVAPMLWHGRIKTDKLPEGAFDVATLTTPPSSFVFSTKKGA